MRRRYRINSFGNCCLETERLLNEAQVVVYCLGNTHNGHLEPSVAQLLRYSKSRSLSPVPADCKEHIYIHPVKRIDYLTCTIAIAA